LPGSIESAAPVVRRRCPAHEATRIGHTFEMDHLPSPTSAERNQERKRSYLPPAWPLLAIPVVVVIVILVTR
jgi:hypothetical protein